MLRGGDGSIGLVHSTVENIKKILGGDIEIHRIESNEIHIAERIRLHLMDSGIRVVVGDNIALKFSVCAQQSDFKGYSAPQLYEQIHRSTESFIQKNGFRETKRHQTKKNSPSNLEETLDIWFEIDYQKEILTETQLKNEIEAVLEIEKFIRP